MAVGKGEVSVRLNCGMRKSFRTDRGFSYGEEVFVYFNFHKLEITKLLYPHEVDLEDPAAPACPEKRDQSEEYPIEQEKEVEAQEGSVPLPDGRFEEFLGDFSSEY